MFDNISYGHFFLTLAMLTYSIVVPASSDAANLVEASMKNGGSSSSSSEDLPIPPGIKPLGRRGGRCEQQETYANLPNLTVLRPSEESRANTRQAFPTFLVYTPVDVTEQSPADLTLENENAETILVTPIDTIPGNSVISVTLPEQDAELLDVGESYTAIFRIYCQNPNKRPSRSTIVSRAFVTRIASTQEQEAWYDDIARAFNSNRELWSRLLGEEGLESIPAALFEESN